MSTSPGSPFGKFSRVPEGGPAPAAVAPPAPPWDGTTPVAPVAPSVNRTLAPFLIPGEAVHSVFESKHGQLVMTDQRVLGRTREPFLGATMAETRGVFRLGGVDQVALAYRWNALLLLLAMVSIVAGVASVLVLAVARRGDPASLIMALPFGVLALLGLVLIWLARSMAITVSSRSGSISFRVERGELPAAERFVVAVGARLT